MNVTDDSIHQFIHASLIEMYLEIAWMRIISKSILYAYSKAIWFGLEWRPQSGTINNNTLVSAMRFGAIIEYIIIFESIL